MMDLSAPFLEKFPCSITVRPSFAGRGKYPSVIVITFFVSKVWKVKSKQTIKKVNITFASLMLLVLLCCFVNIKQISFYYYISRSCEKNEWKIWLINGKMIFI